MAGYPPGGPSYPYGAPPTQPYAYGGGPPPSAPYAGEKPHKAGSGGGGYPSAPPAPGGGSGYPYASAPGGYPVSAPPPPASGYGGGYPPATVGYGSPFASLVPSAFPPGTDPNVVACFQAADSDGSGFIDDKELQMALSSYNQSFSLRTVHLLMYLFTNSNVRKIGKIIDHRSRS